jgi:hypothetical protein
MYHDIFFLQPPPAAGYFEKTMVFAEIPTGLPKAGYFRPAMDARTVARIASINLGTLNSWVQRGLIPGMTIGIKGKPRDIDLLTALRIVVFAELVRRLAPPEYAAQVAKSLSETQIQAGWLYLIAARQADRLTIVYYSPDDRPRGSDLIRQFEDAQDAQDDPSAFSPPFFAAINLSLFAGRCREAERAWQESREGKR